MLKGVTRLFCRLIKINILNRSSLGARHQFSMTRLDPSELVLPTRHYLLLCRDRWLLRFVICLYRSYKAKSFIPCQYHVAFILQRYQCHVCSNTESYFMVVGVIGLHFKNEKARIVLHQQKILLELFLSCEFHFNTDFKNSSNTLNYYRIELPFNK